MSLGNKWISINFGDFVLFKRCEKYLKGKNKEPVSVYALDIKIVYKDRYDGYNMKSAILWRGYPDPLWEMCVGKLYY